MSLLELLQTYADSDTLAMHMPGHKRNTDLAPYLATLSAQLDLTEIPGFSNLHDPAGAIAQQMQQAARLWGSRQAWWLVGGSTAGLLAAIDAATQPGDQVILARNCHKSVYNACMLCALQTAYIQPARFPNQSFADRVTPEQVEAALEAHPNARLVVLTSPTYEGLVSDITAISPIVHRYGAVLLVDEAHGAHLGFHPAFPPSAVTQGADLVVQSLHKTLPSLTQTALLHLCSHRVPAEELGFRLSVYQTSSPSYLLMASIDSCVELLADQADRLFPPWAQTLEAFSQKAAHWQHLSLPLSGVRYTDPSKLLISTRGTNLTGPLLAERLRKEYAIETEMSTADTVLAMTGLGDRWAQLERLADALSDIDRQLARSEASPLPPMTLPPIELTIAQGTKADTELCPLSQALHRVSGEFLWAYPQEFLWWYQAKWSPGSCWTRFPPGTLRELKFPVRKAAPKGTCGW